MKYIKIKISFLLIIVITLMISSQVYAKTSIEIKPNGNLYTNKTISEFFDESMAMKNTGECLEGSNVDVHMATNLDWAIVSYFSNSAYGTNGEGKHTGTKIMIDGNEDHYSTNGNITGVMDWGKNNTYTAGIIANYSDITDETIKNNGKSLISNSNTKYVDEFEYAYWGPVKKYAATQWYSSGGTYLGNSVSKPYTMRKNLFRMTGGGFDGFEYGQGGSSVTFRPVITGN